MRLGSIFCDGAVLQRGMQVPVWGQTVAGAIVHVVCGETESYGKSSREGKFTVYLPAMEVGGPYDLTVTAGDDSITIHDVLIGEVWLAGGQSNMQCMLHPSQAEHSEERVFKLCFEQEEEYVNSIKETDNLRSILVPRIATGVIEDSFDGAWRKFTKENVRNVGAVVAWFGRKMQETLKVPVGIIECNWGGTFVESWTSRGAMMQNLDTVFQLEESDRNRHSCASWHEAGNRPKSNCTMDQAVKDVGNKGVEDGWASLEYDDIGWKNMTVPGSWIEQKISGNGALWVRHYFELPASWIGKPLELHLGAIDKLDTTYFNGVEVGRTGKDFDVDYWNRERIYSVPADLVKTSRCIVAIRAYSFLFDGRIGGPASQFYLKNTETEERIVMAGTWKALAETDYGIICERNDPALSFCCDNPNIPGTLFNCMVHAVIPYAMRGVIWYQGESNALTPADSRTYCDKLRCMINDWRYQWGQGDFPFIQMVLAGFYEQKSFDKDAAWAILRDEQLRVCDNMNKVYAASAIDIGDVTDIHPPNKKDAGYRMARVALAKCYGYSNMNPSGPHLNKYSFTNNCIALEFNYADGLAFRDGTPRGFYLMDANNQEILPQSVTIQNNTVLIKLNAGAAPAELYYAWADNPIANLINIDNLPADPFHIKF